MKTPLFNISNGPHYFISPNPQVQDPPTSKPTTHLKRCSLRGKTWVTASYESPKLPPTDAKRDSLVTVSDCFSFPHSLRACTFSHSPFSKTMSCTRLHACDQGKLTVISLSKNLFSNCILVILCHVIYSFFKRKIIVEINMQY